MTSPNDQPRLLLLESATRDRVGEKRARRPMPGRIRRGVIYVLTAIRTQPALTLGTALLCVVIGISHLWATQPYWIVRAEYRISSLENDPAASPLRVTVEAGELRDLLVSDTVVRAAVADLEQIPVPGSTAGSPPISPARQAAIRAWRALRAVPGQAAAVLGLRRDGEQTEATLVHVGGPDVSDADRVVKIEVHAISPEIAELLPELLLDGVRTLLRREDRSRTMARIEELRPLREAAEQRLHQSNAQVAQYRLEIGRHDPEVSAQEIQSRLVRTRGDRADLETDLREAEANRIDIANKLELAAVEQTTKVVVEQNQRIRQLKEEISTLESQYAANLAVKTEKHQDMVRLRLEIESLKRDLNNEELLVVREQVREPSMEYVGLLERQAQNNRQLVTLAGRELGLAETESLLQTQLVEAMKAAQRMEELLLAREASDAALGRIDHEMVQLESRLTSVVPFSQITLVGRPQVADETRPDIPDATRHLLYTLAATIVLAMLAPTFRCLVRSRLIASWQVEQLAEALPVQLTGELPSGAQRLLARLPGGGGR